MQDNVSNGRRRIFFPSNLLNIADAAPSKGTALEYPGSIRVGNAIRVDKDDFPWRRLTPIRRAREHDACAIVNKQFRFSPRPPPPLSFLPQPGFVAFLFRKLTTAPPEAICACKRREEAKKAFSP